MYYCKPFPPIQHPPPFLIIEVYGYDILKPPWTCQNNILCSQMVPPSTSGNNTCLTILFRKAILGSHTSSRLWPKMISLIFSPSGLGTCHLINVYCTKVCGCYFVWFSCYHHLLIICMFSTSCCIDNSMMKHWQKPILKSGTPLLSYDH